MLLVDDEPMFLAGALARSSTTTSASRSWAPPTRSLRAIELADAEHPDVALVDLAMPGMNGFELTKKLLANEPRCGCSR